MNRREFLYLSAGLTFGVNNLAFSFDGSNDASVITIFLSGGISHIEFANPIPDAPVEFRSTRGSAKTKSGFLLGGDFINLASISNDLTIVRTLNTKDSNHETSTLAMMTGHFHVPNQGQKEPSVGAIVSSQFGTNLVKGMPTYIKIDKVVGSEASWLGAKYNGYDLDQQGVANLFPQIGKERFENRIKIMSSMDSATKDQLSKSWGEVKEQAVNIIKGDISSAFNIDNEDSKIKERYGVAKDQFGKNCLIALKLIKSGCRNIILNHGGWDMHSDISNGFANRAPSLDRYATQLIKDLKDAGHNTLVVICGEFGRTPRINTGSGRDHFNILNTVIFAGGNYNHGRVIGVTDKNATSTIDKEFYTKDLYKTIIGHYGIDRLIIKDNQQRPRHIIDETARNILA